MKTKEKKKNVQAESSGTSEQRSHSVWSNTKLTFISFLAALGFAGCFGFLGFYGIIPDITFYCGFVICGALTVLTMCLFSRFKR